MDIETLIVNTHAEESKSNRVFRVSLLHVVSMPYLMGYGERGVGLPLRPAMLSFAAGDAECRAFATNARGGKLIEARNQAGTVECKIELMKYDGYRAAVNRMADGATAITLFSPSVFQLEARPEDRVAFGMAVPIHWVDGMVKSLAAAGGLGKIPLREAAVAMWFVAYLDRRCRTPLLSTAEFSWRLWKSAIEKGFVHNATVGDRKKSATWVNPSQPIGLEVVAMIYADTDTVEDWIAKEVKRYVQLGGGAVIEEMLRDAEERVQAQEDTLFAVREQEEAEERERALLRATMPERTGGESRDGQGKAGGHQVPRYGGPSASGADQVRDQLGLFGEVAI